MVLPEADDVVTVPDMQWLATQLTGVAAGDDGVSGRVGQTDQLPVDVVVKQVAAGVKEGLSQVMSIHV